MGMLAKSLKHSIWYASKILHATRYAEQNKEVRGTPWGRGYSLIHVMLLFFLSLEPGSDTYPYQDPLYRSESCRRKLRKTAPCGSPGMATQDRQACRRRYLCFSISCRSTWQLSSEPSPPVQSEFHDRDAK